MLAAMVLAVSLGQASPPPLVLDPEFHSARLLPQEPERPPSAAWTWSGAIGGGIAGTSIGVNVAVAIAESLPSQTQASLNPTIFTGAIAVGLVGGTVAGYLLGKAAREGWLPGKIGVWSIWGVLATAATIAVAVGVMLALTVHTEPVETGAGAVR